MRYIEGKRGVVGGLIVIVFNTSNSLAGHGLVPTLCALCDNKQLPRKFSVLKVKHARCASTHCRRCVVDRLDGFMTSGRRIRSGVESFYDRLRCRALSPTRIRNCRLLSKHLRRFANRGGPSGLLFCLTAPPSLCNIVPLRLGTTNLGHPSAHVVIRGPFNCSLRSTEGLGDVCTSIFGRRRVCHVSRFLNGRATRGVLTFHFTGKVFRPL